MKIMKKLFLVMLMTLAFASCADEQRIDGTIYVPYGIANEDALKNDSIQYQVAPEAVVSTIIFCETLVVPVYIIGFELWEPIGLKGEKKGVRK